MIERPNCSLSVVMTSLVLMVFLIGQPSIAEANVGTPLMWATMLHMFIGNALIGVLEGTLLARFYRVSAVKANGLMILANYFSAWVGWTALSEFALHRHDLTLYNVRSFLWGLIAIAYVMTLFLEWPFVAIAVWGRGHDLRRSFIASLFVQSVSYLLLFGWFGLVSVNSLLTDVTIVPPEQITFPADVRVYYIADNDGDVYSLEPGTGKLDKIFDLNSTDPLDCLSFAAADNRDGYQELVVLPESAERDEATVVHTGVFIADADCPLDERQGPAFRQRYPGPSYGAASRLGAANDSPWSFDAGFWPLQGLSGENSKTGEHLRYSLEMPFVQWAVRHAILLPEDKVLFQLGQRQTCLLDVAARKVAILCSGHGAVAILEQLKAPASATE